MIVEYDGSGDSGQIEYIEARDASDEKLALPSIPKVQLASAMPENPPVEITFTFVFYLVERLITLQHSERYTEIKTISHEF